MDDAEALYDRAAELIQKAVLAPSAEERRRLLREAKEVGIRAALLSRALAASSNEAGARAQPGHLAAAFSVPEATN